MKDWIYDESKTDRLPHYLVGEGDREGGGRIEQDIDLKLTSS